jgi:hypothetical protein
MHFENLEIIDNYQEDYNAGITLDSRQNGE